MTTMMVNNADDRGEKVHARVSSGPERYYFSNKFLLTSGVGIVTNQVGLGDLIDLRGLISGSLNFSTKKPFIIRHR